MIVIMAAEPSVTLTTLGENPIERAREREREVLH